MDWMGYSASERGLICQTFASAAKRTLSDEEKSALLNRLLFDAVRFLSLQEVLPFPAPSEEKKQLQKLEAAERRLSAAISEVRPSTWYSIFRTEMPEESGRVIFQSIYDAEHIQATAVFNRFALVPGM